MSNIATFASTPRTEAIKINAANENVDGTGTIATVFTAGASGSRIDEITIKSMEATGGDGQVRLWLHDGSNYFLWRTYAHGSVTPSDIQISWESIEKDLGLILKPGWSLRASTHLAKTFAIIVTNAGDF